MYVCMNQHGGLRRRGSAHALKKKTVHIHPGLRISFCARDFGLDFLTRNPTCCTNHLLLSNIPRFRERLKTKNGIAESV